MASYSKAEVEVRRGPPAHHRQVCLLCLEELNDQHRGNSSNSNNETALYLKNLFYFLKVDVSKIPLGSSSSSHHPGLRGNHCWTEEEVVRCSAICSECDFLVDAFGEKYKVFEPAWKKILTCIQMLKTKTNKNPSTTPQPGDDGGESGLSKYHNLRAVLLAKYNLVLKSDVDEELPPNCVREPQAVSNNAQEYIIYDVEEEGEENGSAADGFFWDDDVESQAAADQMEDSNNPGLESKLDQAGQVGEEEEEEDVREYEELSGVQEEEDDGRGQLDKEEEENHTEIQLLRSINTTSLPSTTSATPVTPTGRSCDYCPMTFRRGPKSQVEKHLVCAHTVKYFPEHFAGFSQEEIDAVTEDILLICRREGQLLCFFCPDEFLKESDKKFHLLQQHVVEVLKACLERRSSRETRGHILDEKGETGQVGLTISNTAMAVEKGDAQIKLEPRRGNMMGHVKKQAEVDDDDEEEIDDSKTEDLHEVRDRNVDDLQQESDKNEPEMDLPPPQWSETSHDCSYCDIPVIGTLEDLDIHQMVSHTVRYYADQGNALIGRSTDEEVDKIVEDLISQYVLFFSAPPENQQDTPFQCSLCPEGVALAGDKRSHFLLRHLDVVQSTLGQSWRRRRVPVISNRVMEPSSSSSSASAHHQLRSVKQEPPEEPFLNAVTSAAAGSVFPLEEGVPFPVPTSSTTTELEQMRSLPQANEQEDLEDPISPSPSISSSSRNNEQLNIRTPSKKRGSRRRARRPILEHQCLYCKLPFRGAKANLERHVMRFHAHQHLSQQLRPGTSKEALKSAIDRICAQSLKSYGNSREGRFDCSLCSRPITSDKKYHLLKEHLPELLSQVEKEEEEEVGGGVSSGGVPACNFDESFLAHSSGPPRPFGPDRSSSFPMEGKKVVSIRSRTAAEVVEQKMRECQDEQEEEVTGAGNVKDVSFQIAASVGKEPSSSASAHQLRSAKQEPPEEPLNNVDYGPLFSQEDGVPVVPTLSRTLELEQTRHRQIDEQADLDDLILLPSPSISFSRTEKLVRTRFKRSGGSHCSTAEVVQQRMHPAATRVGDYSFLQPTSSTTRVDSQLPTTGSRRRSGGGPGTTRPQPQSSGVKRRKCLYCTKSVPWTRPKDHVERHMTCVHTSRHFAHRLSPGISQSELNSAVARVCTSSLNYSAPRRFHCSLCNQFRTDDKYHVLKKHFGAVLARLAEKRSIIGTPAAAAAATNLGESSASPPPSSLQVDIKEEAEEAPPEQMDMDDESVSDKTPPQVSSKLSEINRQVVIIQSFFKAKRDYFKSTNIMPPFTYAFIVGQAILESDDSEPKQLSTSDIVSWAQTNFLYCRHLARLQRNVREALAENNCFVRVRPLGHRDDLWEVREEEFVKTKWFKDTQPAKRMMEEYEHEASIWASSSSSPSAAADDDDIMEIPLPSTSKTHMQRRLGASYAFQAKRKYWRTYKGSRPPFTYIFLIQKAIIESPKNELNLSEIYAWLQINFRFFRNHPNMEQWKRTVRTTLNHSKCFARVDTTDDSGIWAGGWRVRAKELYNPRTKWLYMRKYGVSTRKRKR